MPKRLASASNLLLSSGGSLKVVRAITRLSFSTISPPIHHPAHVERDDISSPYRFHATPCFAISMPRIIQFFIIHFISASARVVSNPFLCMSQQFHCVSVPVFAVPFRISAILRNSIALPLSALPCRFRSYQSSAFPTLFTSYPLPFLAFPIADMPFLSVSMRLCYRRSHDRIRRALPKRIFQHRNCATGPARAACHNRGTRG